uniref:N-acetyltransferase domain-containing protein n=1 Tax=Asterionellopsis glacialis TaxID=33640 RepID=A0A6T9YKF7_9STRA|mmetsp:Transcript_64/g.84  ORF Transcript_64/g.84 Transcript_64/m.84 type:complete len:176 (+) Transcript_64:117-644(+)
MTTLRRFEMDDLFKFNNVNLDVLTETYNLPFYMSYMSQWPESFTVAEAPDGSLMGYMLGKAEGEGKLWHGHVSAVTVAPEYRRLGLAKTLMDDLESTCIQVYNAFFVDLFVRASNRLAISMYEKFGYVTYRKVLGYYSGDDPEDALDMRKALPRDQQKESVIPLDHPVHPEDLEW